jgi:hypothetical protein
MSSNSLIVLVLLVGATFPTKAQVHLPSLEGQIKSGVAFIPEMQDQNYNRYSYVAPEVNGEINWNASQYIAIGAFFSKAFSANVKYEGSFGGETASYESSHLMYGLQARLSSGRQATFRPFIGFSYGILEMYTEKEAYRISAKANVFGLSLGLMVRVSSKLYLVIPQFSLRGRSDSYYFEEPSDFALGKYAPFIEVNGGLSYNIGKKK